MSQLRLPGRADSVMVARHAIAAALRRNGIRGDVVFAARLVVSELVGNAVRHAPPSPITVSWSVAGDRVRIEVCDDSHVLPRPVQSNPTDESGRGLLLVETMSARWGSQRTGSGPGKVVWAELDLAR